MTGLQDASPHPFRHAYKIDNSIELSFSKHLFDWTSCVTQTNNPHPEFWVVGHEHMQDAAQKVSHYKAVNGQVFGWFTKNHPNSIFVSNRIKMANSKQARGVVVHELVHYIQFNRLKDRCDTMDELETEADHYMHKYVASSR